MPRLGHRWGLIVRALSGSMRDKKLSESRCKPSRMDRTATCDGRGAMDVAPSPPFLRADPVAPQRAWRILGSVGPRTNLLTNPLANPLGGCRSEGRKQGSPGTQATARPPPSPAQKGHLLEPCAARVVAMIYLDLPMGQAFGALPGVDLNRRQSMALLLAPLVSLRSQCSAGAGRAHARRGIRWRQCCSDRPANVEPVDAHGPTCRPSASAYSARAFPSPAQGRPMPAKDSRSKVKKVVLA